MAKTLIPASHLTLPEVEERLKQTKEAVENTHWQIIRLMLMGKRAPEIAGIVNLSVGWVRELVRRYNQKGSAGLKDQRLTNGGNRWILNEDQRQELANVLEHENPPDNGLWTSKKVQAWIKEKTEQDISLTGAWQYFKRLGFSIRVLRLRHLKADSLQQEEFKKKYSTQ